MVQHCIVHDTSRKSHQFCVGLKVKSITRDSNLGKITARIYLESVQFCAENFDLAETRSEMESVNKLV